MSGYICNLKSNISTALAEQLGMIRLETKQLGLISTAEDKSHRYEKLTNLLRSELTKERDIILDGTFGKREYRQPVYAIAEQTRVEDIVIVSCSCYDKEEIWRRIRERGNEVKNDDLCVQEWLNGSHDDLVREVVEGGYSYIAIDTGEYLIYPLKLISDFSHLVKDRLSIIVEQLRKYFVPSYRKSAEAFADFLGNPCLFWDELIPVEVAVREFVDARKKYKLPEDASFACLSVDEIKGKGRNHYYGRYHFENGDINFFDFGFSWTDGGGRRTGVLSKWANLESMDGGSIDAISISFTPDPNW